MSFTIAGVTWTPQDATTKAQAIFDLINADRAARGEPPLVASIANIMWIMALASGNMAADSDAALAAAANSFNVALCDDSQVLNLLPVAGTELLPGSYSSLTIRVTAASTGSCIVPIGASVPYGSVNFLTTVATTIPAGTYADIVTVCDTKGAINVAPAGVNRFATAYANFGSLTNLSASVPGSSPESATGARQRIIQGRTIDWNIDGTAQALRAIPGIQNAMVYFNVDTTNNLVLTGGTTIPPRHAAIVVQGADASGTGTAIADAYASRMTAPTDGTSSENYTSTSGQTIAINYYTASAQNIYVKVYYSTAYPTQSGFDTIIKDTIVAQNGSVSIGQLVTSDFILQALDGFLYATITGAEVSLDGISYSRKVSCDAVKYPSFAGVRITVTGE